uniref:CN hydrolase domain-containing protein n=1 Tax=Populus trichocarpa TaxID=3694 RepID=A0A2K2B8X0_POPTR
MKSKNYFSHPPPTVLPLSITTISSTTTLLSSKNLSLKLHLNHSPLSRLPSSLFRSKSNTHFPSLLPRNNSTHNQKSQIHTPIMASFMPEQARAPPALPLPVPPVTKFKIGLCQLSVTADKERNIAESRK